MFSGLVLSIVSRVSYGFVHCIHAVSCVVDLNSFACVAHRVIGFLVQVMEMTGNNDLLWYWVKVLVVFCILCFEIAFCLASISVL